MGAVFLSYARVDAREEADKLYQDLSAARRALWVDRYNLRVGERWGPEIKDAIRKAEAFVLLMTPGAFESAEVEKEWREAIRVGKNLLPLMIKPCDPPEEIRTLQILDFTNGDRRTSFAQLLGELDRGWERAAQSMAALQVQGQGLPKEFDTLSEKLGRFVEQKSYLDIPPEAYRVFADLLSRMNTDMRSDRDLRSLIEDTLDNRYPLPSWPWQDVFQAHPEFFAKQLRDWQSKLPNQPLAEPVPIVLLVMSQPEALDLQSGAALENETEELKAFFADIQEILEADPAMRNWPARYGSRREDWRAYGEGGTSLGDLVRQELRRAGDALAPPKPFVPRFIPIGDLEGPQNRVKLRDLRESGCVVIMDVLSMCHPAIHAPYRRSLLEANSKTFLVKVGPLVPLPYFHRELTFRVNQRLDLEFSSRLELDSDHRCKRLFDLVDLRNYIYNEIWTVTPQSAWPTKGPRPYWLR